MRVEPDRKGNFSSEAPACHRCGIPLLEESTFCPYCERSLDDAAPATATHPLGRIPAVDQRLLLSAGAVFFAVVAFACVAAAFLI